MSTTCVAPTKVQGKVDGVVQERPRLEVRKIPRWLKGQQDQRPVELPEVNLPVTPPKPVSRPSSLSLFQGTETAPPRSVQRSQRKTRPRATAKKQVPKVSRPVQQPVRTPRNVSEAAKREKARSITITSILRPLLAWD